MKMFACLLLPAVFLTACTTVSVQLPTHSAPSPAVAASAPKTPAPTSASAHESAPEVNASPEAAEPTTSPAPTVAAVPNALSGTAWKLQSIERVVENRNETLDPAPTLEFDTTDPGHLDGSVGCNNYRIPYTLAPDDTLTLDDVLFAEPLSYCSDLIRVQNLYLDALELMTRVSATPTELTLSDETGALELYFVPALDGQ